jgi:hypothetical protein
VNIIPHQKDKGRDIPGLYILPIKTDLSAHFYFTEAITAIHWSVFTWLERDFGIFTTLSTYRRIHLAGCVSLATISVTCLLSCLATLGAAFGFVGIAL